jgi:hypothetical protein
VVFGELGCVIWGVRNVTCCVFFDWAVLYGESEM